MKGYTLLEHQKIDELSAEGYVWRHNKSGAQVFYLRNPEDSNKVFCISFCTPPEDDCGIPHILEHSVLCGSEAFPLKDPFIQLAKGSLNTFLNAMTYPDKTMYPVASENDADFMNLMNVYMDAVFHPNILREPRILMQEGWHYEIDENLSSLSIKGVVYNEMKGAFSSSEEVLFREIKKELYPDTPYTYESGGDPEAIPQLTYESFLRYYKAHYQASNSYIYIYGDGDMDAHLSWLDEQYLKDMEDTGVRYSIPMQPPYMNPHRSQGRYSLTSSEDPAGKTYLSYNTVYGPVTDPLQYYASDILEYMLLETEGAPLKKALQEQGLGEDIFGYNDNSLLQPTFGIVVKNAEQEQEALFIDTVRSTCRSIVQEGWNQEMLEGALNRFEFRLREGDYGSTPAGLIYGITSMDSWLHGESPMRLMHYNAIYTELRKKAREGYFEELLNRLILDNPHTLIYTLVPEQGLTSQKEQEEQKRLDTYLSSLTMEQKRALRDCTQDLQQYQQEPETEEALNSVPLLSLSDIPVTNRPYPYSVFSLHGTEVVRYQDFTNGIVYLKLLFPIDTIEKELLPYVSLLCDILGSVDTEKRSYEAMGNAVNFHTGGIGMSIHVAEPDANTYMPYFKIIGKCLYPELSSMLSLILEQLLESRLTDQSRIRNLVAEVCSRHEMRIQSSGHTLAAGRAMACFNRAAAFKDSIRGLSYYETLKELNDHFDEMYSEFTDILRTLCRRIFTRNRLLIHLTQEEKSCGETDAIVSQWLDLLPYQQAPEAPIPLAEPMNENLGLLGSGQVQYVAQAGTFSEPYSGSLQVLRSILGLDYLWNQVRVLGGAYGCMCGVNRLGLWYIVSYRDPGLEETMEVYQKASQYIQEFNCTKREMDKYIIGTISNLSQPMTISMRGNLTLDMYLNHITEDMLNTVRKEVLCTTPEDIRRLSGTLKSAMEQQHLCVYGSEEKLRHHAELFDRLQELI